MRIMIASPSYWPSQDGVTIITSYLAEGLAARGHEIFVLTSAGNGGLQNLPYNEEHKGVDIKRMRIYTRWPIKIKGRDKDSSKEEYWDTVIRYDPDVLIVVCSQTWTLDWIMPVIGKLQCKKVFYSHGYSAWRDKYPIREELKKRNILGVYSLLKCKQYYQKLYQYIALFDRAIYLSEENNAATYAKKYRLTNGKVLKNAIDDIFFQQGMEHTYEKKSTLRFLFVGNYNENKNQKMLVRAFQRTKMKQAELVLVGFEKNKYLQELLELINPQNTDDDEKRIIIQTNIAREQVIEQYRKCDVFVCASHSETYSIVAHEAGATGMPIISTNVGIYCKIPGVYLVSDEEQMKNAMEKMYYNADERNYRGQKIRQWVCEQKCRTADKIDWLENDLKGLMREN